jgi:formamidopyrimidine-DNA glycosylase
MLPLEGPEVKHVAKRLELLSGHRITTAEIFSNRYTRYENVYFKRLNGASITHVTCKGKLIAIHLSSGDEHFAILNTLGTTGSWEMNYTQNPANDRFERISLKLDDGSVCAFFDKHNFGTIKIVSYAEMKRKKAELGPDILALPKTWASVELPQFYERVSRFGKMVPIAEALLDQRIAAGAGIYIRADAMYLARISPFLVISDLSHKELYRIWLAMFNIARASELNQHPRIDLDNNSQHEELEEQLASQPFTNLVYNRHQSPFGGIVETYKDKFNHDIWWSPKEQIAWFQN